MHASMLVVQGRPHGKCISFPPGEYLVGRGEECHIRLNSPWVSRQHCSLLVTSTQIFVRDLGSTNGTLVNGQCVTDELQLQTSDRLQIGPLVLQILEPSTESSASAGSKTPEDQDSGSSMEFESVSTP